MIDLEAMLRDLASDVEFPKTPDIAARFLAGIEVTGKRHRRAWPLALTAAMLLIFTSTAVAAVPAAREAFLEFLRLGQNVTVRRVDTLPSIPNTSTLEPGRRVLLSEARDLVSFELLLPGALGAPDAVYVSTYSAGGEVVFVYRPRPGLPRAPETGVGALVTEFRRDRLGGELVQKLVGDSGDVERFRIDGDEALWIDGPHLFIFRRPGEPSPEVVRLAAGVLIVQKRDIYVRIESTLPKSRVIETARTLSP